MIQTLRKTFFIISSAFLIAFFFSFVAVNAATPVLTPTGGGQGTQSGYQLLANLPTITKTSGITLVDYMKGLFVATIGLAIVLAVVELVIGGIEYVAAAVPSAKEDAKKRIGGAIGGLLLILIAWVLLQALNPKLLNVGLNLQDISMVGGGGPSTGPGPAPTPGPGGPLNCTNGACANNTAIANAVKNNSSGVNPNIQMAILQAGENSGGGCTTRASGTGPCGYSQVTASNRKQLCHMSGTAAQTCALIQNNTTLDINCGATVINNFMSHGCGPSVTVVASCYATGSKTKCGNPGDTNYCQRVTKYYSTCN